MMIILTMADQLESRIWSIERRHCQWPWTTPTTSFKVAPFFDAKYPINGLTYRHSFNEKLIGTYTHPTQQCHFEWPWVTLSHLAKYSVTRSIARSLCDSWASCFFNFSVCPVGFLLHVKYTISYRIAGQPTSALEKALCGYQDEQQACESWNSENLTHATSIYF